MTKADLDPVAERLSGLANEQPAALIEWMAAQRRREEMRRRAVWCSVGSFATIAAAAVISSLVAVWLSSEVRELFRADTLRPPELPWTITVFPPLLAGLAGLLLLGGLLAWRLQRFPGLNAIRSALDWNAAGDAVARLLSAGCNYPEAFRAAAEITRSQPSRNWLESAAEQVERGATGPSFNALSRGDQAVFEILIDVGEGEPAHSWRVAAEHFFGVAYRRLAWLLGAVPILATIVSGMLIWIAITTTLSSIWWATAQLIEGLG